MKVQLTVGDEAISKVVLSKKEVAVFRFLGYDQLTLKLENMGKKGEDSGPKFEFTLVEGQN